jgi:hypothetical protein
MLNLFLRFLDPGPLGGVYGVNGLTDPHKSINRSPVLRGQDYKCSLANAIFK